MKIILSPQACEAPQETKIERAGSVISINGNDVDLSGVATGDILFNLQQWSGNELEPGARSFDHPDIVGDIIVGDDGPEITVLFPIDINAEEEARFPTAIAPGEGKTTIPPLRKKAIR